MLTRRVFESPSLTAEQRRKIVSFAADTSKVDLGLGTGAYEELSAGV
jgi:hypothetical protein